MGDEGMSGHISKGPVHRKVDARVNSMNADQRQAFRDALADPAQSYLNVLNNFNVGLTVGEETYLRDHWYIQPEPPQWNGWWRGLQPIEPIIRQGLIKAINESLTQNPPLPIDSYWVTAGAWAPAGRDVQVEVFVSRSNVQVTRIIYTPPTEPPENKQRPFNPNLWIVKAESDPVQPGNQRPEETAESVVTVGARRIVTWRRREF